MLQNNSNKMNAAVFISVWSFRCEADSFISSSKDEILTPCMREMLILLPFYCPLCRGMPKEFIACPEEVFDLPVVELAE